MKFIAILLLCSRLLPSLTLKYHWQAIDCNDEDVFNAVDSALNEYNSGSKSGNQFVLYRVTEVNKTGDQETFYSIKYEIKEGDCPVQSGKSWQDCDYKEAEQAATGECTAIVGEKANNLSVATQTCHITPAVGPLVTLQYDCVGCVHPISAASPGLEPVLRHAIQHFNNHTNHSHLFALREVKRAHRQVVAGWKYEVTYLIEQTNCSKENFQFLTPDCKFLLNGDIGDCTDHAYVDAQLRIASFSQDCKLHPGFWKDIGLHCVGCPSEIPVDSPRLKGPLKHSIAKLNAENNGTFYFKVDTVKKATTQVVAGTIYAIEFMARETTCSKESDKELTEDCEINLLGEVLRCTAEVYEVLWLNKTESTIKCQPVQKTLMLRRPPGFSPFRSVQVKETKEVTTVSPSHTSMAPVQEEQDSEKEQRPMQEHGWGHEKKRKHGLGLGHKHEHDQGHGHQRGHGLGHGYQQRHDHGHGQQRELNYNPEHQGRQGFGHGHQWEHGLAHGHKHEHGHGHGKHKNKGKKNGKHNDWGTMHWESSSEDSTTSAQTYEKTGRPTSFPSPAQPGVAGTFSDFQDLDLIAAAMTNIPPTTPTPSDDAWIPEIQIKPNSLSFNLIPDFPETSSPKCPGRPWKPLNGMNPTVEMKDFHDFDLSDALY